MNDKSKIKKIIEPFFDGQQVDDGFSLKEAGISSIEIIKILVQIEKVFGIEVPDEMLELSSFNTLDDICELVERVKEVSYELY